MAYRYLIISLIISVFTIDTFAQAVAYSLPEKYSQRSDALQILGKLGNEYYVHLEKGRDQQINIYREDLGLRAKRYIDLHRKERIEKIFLQDSSLIVFYTRRVKGYELLKMKKYDLEVNADTTELVIDSVSRSFTSSSVEYNFQLSEDKSKLIIYSLESKLGRDDIFRYIVMDRQHNIISRRTADLPTSRKRSDINKILLDDQGKVYVTLAEYKDLSQNNVLRIYILSEDNDFQERLELTLEAETKKYFNNVFLKFDNFNNNIVAAGFYSGTGFGPTGAEGIFYSVFDMADPKVKLGHYEPFGAEFIARLKGRRKIRQDDMLYSFVIDDIILRRDGGALIISESYYKTLRNAAELYDPYRYQSLRESSVTTHFDELLVISIHPDGKIHWQSVLHKSQATIGDLKKYASYSFINTGYSINFLYNDDIDPKTNLIQYSVDIHGNTRREMLLNSYKNDIYLMPQLGRQVDVNEILIPSLKRKRLRLVKIYY